MGYILTHISNIRLFGIFPVKWKEDLDWSQISFFFHVLTLVESFAYMPLLLTAIPNSFECSYMQTPAWLSVVRANLKLAHYNILKFNLSWKICLVYNREILGRNTSLKYISVTNTHIKWMSLSIIKVTNNSISWNLKLSIFNHHTNF